MASKTVHEISIEADLSGTRAALRDLNAEYARIQKKIIEGNEDVTESELAIVAAHQGRTQEMRNLEKAQREIARLDKEAAKGVKDLAGSVKDLGGATKGAVKPAESLRSQLTDMAKKAGLAALAVKGLKEAVDFVKGGFDDLTESIKNSQVLGLTLDQFEGLNILAQSAGASIDDLRNVFGALARAGKDPWQGLMEIAEALEGMGSEAERTKYMVDQYGESGTKLIPMLMGGKDALFDAMEAAQRYGLVLSNEGVEAHNNFTAEVTRLKTEADGLQRTIASELTPMFTDLLKEVRSSPEDLQKMATNLKMVAGAALYLAIGMGTAAKASKRAIVVVGEGIAAVAGYSAKVTMELASASARWWRDDLEQAQSQFNTSMERDTDHFAKIITGTLEDFGDPLNEAAELFAIVDQAIEKNGKTAQKTKEQLKETYGYIDYGPVYDPKAIEERDRREAEAARRRKAAADTKAREQEREKKREEDAKRRQEEREAAAHAAAKKAIEDLQARATLEQEIETAQNEWKAKSAADLGEELKALQAQIAEDILILQRDADFYSAEEIQAKLGRIKDAKERERALLKSYADQTRAETKAIEDAERAALKAAEETAKRVEAEQKSMMRALTNAASSAGSIIADGLFGPMEEGANRLEEIGKRLLKLLAEIAIEAAAAFATQAGTGQAGGGIGGALASAAGFAVQAATGAGFASGGYVSGPGTSTSDSIPARLSNGEYVINAQSVDRYGRAFFDRLNNLMPSSFANGGPAGGGEIVIVNPPSERDFEKFISSNRGRRLIVNASRGIA